MERWDTPDLVAFSNKMVMFLDEKKAVSLTISLAAHEDMMVRKVDKQMIL